jgi:hypothetical protein
MCRIRSRFIFNYLTPDHPGPVRDWIVIKEFQMFRVWTGNPHIPEIGGSCPEFLRMVPESNAPNTQGNHCPIIRNPPSSSSFFPYIILFIEGQDTQDGQGTAPEGRPKKVFPVSGKRHHARRRYEFTPKWLPLYRANFNFEYGRGFASL